MLFAANYAVSVVIKLHQFRTPDDANGQVRRETEVHRGAKALWPGIDRAERRGRPIHRADETPHLSAAHDPFTAGLGL